MCFLSSNNSHIHGCHLNERFGRFLLPIAYLSKFSLTACIEDVGVEFPDVIVVEEERCRVNLFDKGRLQLLLSSSAPELYKGET